MTAQFKQFYSNWLTKVNSYEENNLSDIYDKFVSLFVLYNFLYNQIHDKLVVAEILKPGRLFDKNMATKDVLKFIRADELIESLLKEDAADFNFKNLCEIIEKWDFNIIVRDGQGNRSKDLKLLKEMRSSNNHIKSKALLEYIYHIRCNLFHGDKNYEENQRSLLISINYFLHKIVELIYKKLSSD